MNDSTSAPAIDYDADQPHDNQHLVAAIRERLSLPAERVYVEQTGGGVMCLCVVLDLDADDRTARRYVYLTCDGLDADGWLLGLYDDRGATEEDYGDEGIVVRLVLGAEPTLDAVADATAGIVRRILDGFDRENAADELLGEQAVRDGVIGTTRRQRPASRERRCASRSISDGPMYCKGCYGEVDYAFGNVPVEPFRPVAS